MKHTPREMPSIRYPEVVKLLAKATKLAQELHETLNERTSAEALEIKKQSFNYHKRKLK